MSSSISSSKNNSVMRLEFRILLFGISLFVVFELFFRIAFFPSDSPGTRNDTFNQVLLFDTTEVYEGKISNGPLCELLGQFRINNAGWNSIFDYTPRIDYERPRIAVIGNSYIEGWITDVDNHIDSYLYKFLRGQADVYAFGISAATMAQYIAMTEYAESCFDPDIFILQIGNNAIRSSLGQTSARRYYVDQDANGNFLIQSPTETHIRSPMDRMLCRSALIRYLIFNKRMFVTNTNRINVRIINFAEAEIIGNKELEINDIRLASYLLDTLSKQLNDDIIVLLADANRNEIYLELDTLILPLDYRLINSLDSLPDNVILFDLTKYMNSQFVLRGERYDDGGDSHWNSNGHRTAARAIIPLLLSIFRDG